MINSKLTYEKEESILWLKYTDFLIRYISKTCSHTAFILAGRTAADKAELIDKVINSTKRFIFY